ncbi:MAG TPA: hypothetical protein VFF07_08605 [Actinomycetota bacterium]|nr:hypothetical protein [Actinomycetota bacterium]
MPGPFPTGYKPALVVAAPLVAALLSPSAPGRAVLLAEPAMKVARRCEGSSDPTLNSNNRRLVSTARGRLLALYDPHGAGQQLVWRDPPGKWRKRTRGQVADGFLPGAGRKDRADRPSSIAVARDERRHQSAWIVTSGGGFGKAEGAGVWLRRLSALNHPEGPKVGPAVRVQRGQGARADLAFERGPNGRSRGVISWLRRTPRGTFRFRTAWFTDLSSDEPRIRARSTIFRSKLGSPTGTLVPTKGGMRIIAATGSGRLRLFKHRAGTALRRWRRGRGDVSIWPRSKPSAVALESGRILAAAETRVRGRRVVRVLRFSASGSRVTKIMNRRGWSRPALTSARRSGRAWLVAVRRRDERIVSRGFRPGSGWGRVRVETRVRGPLGAAAPNVPRYSNRRLRVLLAGVVCPGPRDANGVIAYERAL